MQAYSRFISSVSDLLAVFSAVLLTVAMLVIIWMVTYRTLGYSTSWELELAVFLMVCALFLSSPYTLKTHGHVGVDLLTTYLPGHWARRLQFLALWVGFLVTVFLTVLCLEFTVDSFLKGERTESVWAPLKWPLYATMPIGLGLTAAQYIAQIFEFMRQDATYE